MRAVGTLFGISFAYSIKQIESGESGLPPALETRAHHHSDTIYCCLMVALGQLSPFVGCLRPGGRAGWAAAWAALPTGAAAPSCHGRPELPVPAGWSAPERHSDPGRRRRLAVVTLDKRHQQRRLASRHGRWLAPRGLCGAASPRTLHQTQSPRIYEEKISIV